MKIRIEGCTEEQLAKHSTYLKMGKEYEAEPTGADSWDITDEDGDSLNILSERLGCSHIPTGAKWAEVTGHDD